MCRRNAAFETELSSATVTKVRTCLRSMPITYAETASKSRKIMN